MDQLKLYKPVALLFSDNPPKQPKFLVEMGWECKQYKYIKDIGHIKMRHKLCVRSATSSDFLVPNQEF